MKKQLDDKALDALLAAYRVRIDTGEQSIDALARAARIRAVGLKEGLQSHGLFGLVAQIFGLRRASSVAWSAVAGMAFAAVIGVSFGASGGLPGESEIAFSIDFDSVLGHTMSDSAALAQGDQEL